ncbi:hypothetical protein IW261DRAFT_1306753, partial [Armillaria novae-zelandiae]
PFCKVSTLLPDVAAPKTNIEVVPIMPPSFLQRDPHGGRDAARQQRWSLLEEFVQKARKSDGDFWTSVRDITDPKPRPPRISLDKMTAEFSARVNVPDIIPEDFDEVALLQAALEADSIPRVTVDHTEGQYFS